ncbi:MAG TPA: hypothetical protein ENI49_01965, partial [Thermoplasmatales archaeon]|nr:hypothetical protein [Thermoplasmatales archaeon]
MRLKKLEKKIYMVSLVLILAFPYFVEVEAALTATWDDMDDLTGADGQSWRVLPPIWDDMDGLLGVDGQSWTASLPTWDDMDDLTGADGQSWASENAAWDLTVNNSGQHEGSGCLDFAIESTDPDNGSFSISGINEDFSSCNYLKFWVKTPASSSFRFEMEDPSNTVYWDVATSSGDWEEITINLSSPSAGSADLSNIVKVAFSGLDRPGSGVYHYLFDVVYLDAWDLTVNNSGQYEGSGCLEFTIENTDPDNGEFSISNINEDFSSYGYLKFWVKTSVPSSFRFEMEDPSNTVYWDVSTSSTNWEGIIIDLSSPSGGSADLSHIEKVAFSSLDRPGSGEYHYFFDVIYLAAWELVENHISQYEGSGCLEFIIMHDDMDDGEFGVSGINEDFSPYNYLEFWAKTPIPSFFEFEIVSPSGTAYWNVSTSSANWEKVTINLFNPSGGSTDLSHVTKVAFSGLDRPTSGSYHYLFDYISLKGKGGTGEDGYIEGKVFEDKNGNGVYNAGEGIADATVVACCYKKRYTTTTDSEGNYKLPSPLGTTEEVPWDDMDDLIGADGESWESEDVAAWDLTVNNSDQHEGSGCLEFTIENTDPDNGEFSISNINENFSVYSYLTFWVKSPALLSMFEFKIGSPTGTAYWNVSTISTGWEKVTINLSDPDSGSTDLSHVNKVGFLELDRPISGSYDYLFDDIRLIRIIIEEEGLFYDLEGTKYRVEAYKEAENGDLGYKKEMKYVELNLDDHIKTVNFSLTKETEPKAKYTDLYTLWMEIGDLKAVNEYTIVLFDVSKRYWEHAQTKMIPDKVYFQVFREGNFIGEYILDLCDNTFVIQEVLKVEIL